VQQQAPVPPPQQPGQPPVLPQGYYPEAGARNDTPYQDRSAPPYSPSPQYEPELPNYGYTEAGRDDLFAREPGPSGYDQNSYGGQSGYRPDPYAGRQPPMQAQGPHLDPLYPPREGLSPLDEYNRSFTARMAAQDGPPSRFYGDDPGVPQEQNYAAQGGYGHDHYDARFAGHDNWGGADHGGLPQQRHGDLDEDFFPDEDELDQDDYLAPRRGRKKLIAAALVGAIAVGGGGAYYFKNMRGRGAQSAMPVIHADSRPAKEAPGNPGGKQFPYGEKAIYDRLLPNGQQVQTAAFTPSVQAGPAAGNSLEDRIEEALKKAQRSGDAPSTQAQNGRGSDQPTVVRSESYRPDGTRVDNSRPTITPNIANVNNGQLPPPFGNAAPANVQTAAAPFRAAPIPSGNTQQLASAAPTQRPAQPATARTASFTPTSEASSGPTPPAGFYVSLKSAGDEKAIQRELPALSDKYKSVLGDIQLTSKIADLGAKGVKYRAVAGPLGSKQEAMELCQKIKGAGGDCFVTN